MGRLCKLRVWLQQAPSWVRFEKLLGSSITEGEKKRGLFLKTCLLRKFDREFEKKKFLTDWLFLF